MKPLAYVMLLSLLGVVGCDTKLPKFPAPDEVKWLSQNWTPQMWDAFYHTPQGTEIIPYAWFMALEQPSFSLNPMAPPKLFSDADYLARFGFLPSATSALNPDQLPVGFVKDTGFVDPASHEQRTVLALTCAACHTGQLEIINNQQQRIGLRIDGGGAMVNPTLFEAELGKALLLTNKIPTRFNRFARRVLGEEYSAESKSALREKVDNLVAMGLRLQKIRDKKNIYPLELGYGRVDALNDIGNQVFAWQLSDKNWGVSDAPVNFPHIWETSWFDYVQYNGSIPNPLVRNIGESLGVKAPVILTGDKSNWFKTAVNIENLVAMEKWLAGPAPYQGLRAPQWPEAILGAIDRDKASQGERLYAELCVSCHYPSRDVLERDLAAESHLYWTARNTLGQPLLKTVMVDLEKIGTDPKQATDFVERTVDTANLGWGVINAGEALSRVVEQVALRYFAEKNIQGAAQLEYTNGHALAAEARVLKAYRARPLTGIWATPPFLHNGSVPSLYHLLLPAAQRPQSFTLGSRSYDSKILGYDTSPNAAIKPFDTSLPGNSNKGHEFNDGEGSGIIGRKLSEDERWALLEYLKTL